MNGWVPLVVTVSLALYRWWLITQLAKRREAYDLYCSIISLLEQFEADGIKIWTNRLDDLDEYRELSLVSKIADVEQRLQVIQQYYRFRRKSEAAVIDSMQIANLRSYLTVSPDLVPDESTRHIHIHRLTTTMVRNLLEASYEDINKRRGLPY